MTLRKKNNYYFTLANMYRQSLKRAYDGSMYPMVYPPAKAARYNPVVRTSTRRSNGMMPVGNTRRYGRRYGRRYLGQRITANPVYPPPEAKYIDSIDSEVVIQPGSVYLINGIAQGTGASERVGITTVAKSLAYRLEVDLPTTAPVPTSGRIIFVWDKNPQGTPPAFNTVFATNSYNAFTNLANKDRFVILRNVMFSLSPNGDQNYYVEGYIRLGLKTQHQNDGLNSDPNQGGLYMITTSDQSAAGSPPVLSYSLRFRYLDN